MKRRAVCGVVAGLFVLGAARLACGGTIATFADPSNGSTLLFTISAANHTMTGGWDDTKTGLILQIIATGHTFNNAFFTMTNLVYTGTTASGATGAGTIKFFADNDNPQAVVPLFRIDFVSSQVMSTGFGGENIFSLNGVTFSGRDLTGKAFDDQSFAFSFANQKVLSDHTGYSTTASFTSSAIETAPEPATLSLLGIGFLGLYSMRNRDKK